MTQRIILRIELTPNAKEHLNRTSDTLGMTQVAMLSRVVEWFSQQPELIQRIIVGHLPPQIEQQVARVMLRRLTTSGKKESAVV
ncbi:MAG TPA: hypothetical protein VGQ99_22135 [Tepidisphaeraceae bacterium]|nr:hypothetical protein [Tepidisphaeraceae bacterium]